MSTTLIVAIAAAVLLLLVLWAVRRARRIRMEAQEREDDALARLRSGQSPVESTGETMFAEAGLPSRLPPRAGIEVAEVGEVVDLDALLAGEPTGVADRARAQLEEPTNISLGEDTIPPRPVAPVNGAARPAAAAAPVASPAPATPAAPVRPVVRPAAPAPAAAAPMSPAPIPKPAPAAARPVEAAPAQRVAAAAPAPVPAPRPQPQPVAAGAGPASLPERVVQAMQSPPVNGAAARPPGANGSAHAGQIAAAAPARSVATPAPVPAKAAAPVPPAAPVSAGATASVGRGEDVPLRELALAWFEARGYRSSPASSAVRPIELVLRHRHDPARAYAFVVEGAKVSASRVQQLRTQARSIGLLRVLIVAEGGAERGAADNSKGVRLMDRALLDSEFEQLDFSVAAKIIALARKRATPAQLH